MSEREDPLVGFHFSVDVQDVFKDVRFTEVSGLGSEHEIIEHKVVTDKGQEMVLKIPGRLKWENITLKRGITSTMDIWDWRKEIVDGGVDDNRHNGSITMFNQKLEPVAQWTFDNAWPSKVSGPSVKSDSNELGIEEMTLVHEGIVRAPM